MSPSYEIERKFLVPQRPEDLLQESAKTLQQGYIATGSEEVRLRFDGKKATLTCKQGGGLKRLEAEIEISLEQFETLWPLTESSRIEKTRYPIPYESLTIEFDLYHGAHEPLMVAEVEFTSEQQSQEFTPPPYFGEEVTHDSRYKNQALALHGIPTPV